MDLFGERMKNLKDGGFGSAVLQRRLERRLRMAGSEGIADHPLPPARIVLPGVETPEIGGSFGFGTVVRHRRRPRALLRHDNVRYAVDQTQRRRGVATPCGADDVVAHAFLLPTLQQRLCALSLIQTTTKKINVIIDSRIIHQVSNESSGLMPRGRRQRRSAIVSFHQHHGTAGNMRPDESDGYLEVGVLHHVLGPHPVEDELGFVGHANDVILHGVRQEPNTNRTRLKSTTSATNYHPIRNQSGELPAFVDELDEGEPGVLLQ